MRSHQRARYPYPVPRMPCALAVVRCATGFIIGKDRRFRRLYECADPFSCLSPMPPGGDKPTPLRQRRGCGAIIYGDARIRPGAAGILRRFQLRSHDAPSGSGLRAARNHLPRRGRQRRPTPAGRGEPSAARYAFLGTARWASGAKQMNKRAADQWSALRERGPRHVRT